MCLRPVQLSCVIFRAYFRAGTFPASRVSDFDALRRYLAAHPLTQSANIWPLLPPVTFTTLTKSIAVNYTSDNKNLQNQTCQAVFRLKFQPISVQGRWEKSQQRWIAERWAERRSEPGLGRKSLSCQTLRYGPTSIHDAQMQRGGRCFYDDWPEKDFTSQNVASCVVLIPEKMHFKLYLVDVCLQIRR